MNDPLVGGQARQLLDQWDRLPLQPDEATVMTNTQRLALINRVIVAIRPYGHLAEAALEPLQELRDDMVNDRAIPARARAAKGTRAKDGDGADKDEADEGDGAAGD